jgi:hypothetical protein
MKTILSILALVTLASGQIRRRPDPYTGTSLVAAQEPVHTGDLTNSAGSLAMLVNSIHDTVTSVNNAASPYSVVATDSYIACDATAGAVLIKLPATSGSGREITIKKLDSTKNACTPTRAGSDTIDAANTVPITAQYAAVKLVDRVAGSWDRAHVNQLGGAVAGVSSNNTRRDFVSALDFNTVGHPVDPTGSVDSTAGLQAAKVAADAAGKSLYVPAGTYALSWVFQANASVLSLTTNSQQLYGDGMGRTVFVMANSFAGAGNSHQVIGLFGDSQYVHDLTINLGTRHTAPGSLYGVVTYRGAFRSLIKRLEVTGLQTTTQGGAGVSLYQSWNQPEYSTTLGVTIASGVQTVTPASMNGIYVNRQLSIGGTAEYVIVTAATPTTFTATFVNAHNSTDTVQVLSGGRQYAVVEDCYIHDMPMTPTPGIGGAGISVNSSNNEFRNNRIIRVGQTANEHGFYIQGGYGHYIGNVVDGASGYCFHANKQVLNIDGSGDVYEGNFCYDPAFGFAAMTGLTNTSNPEFSGGVNLTRYVTFVNNVCKRRTGNLNTATSCVLNSIGIPIVFSGNAFEDPTILSGTGVVIAGPNSVINGNNFLNTNVTGGTNSAISVGANSVVSNNVISNWVGVGVKTLGTGIQILGNTITYQTGKAGNAFQINHANTIVSGNTVSENIAGQAFTVADSLLGVDVNNNTWISTESRTDTGSVFITTSNTNVYFRNNHCYSSNLPAQGPLGEYGPRIVGTPTNVTLENNECWVSFNGNLAIAQPPHSGRAVMYTAGDSTGKTKLVKLSAGKMVIVATTDTVFDAVTLSDGMTNTTPMLYASIPGSETWIAADGVWVDGNVGIISTTTAGNIHDTGSAQPPTPGVSYVRFIGSGVSGVAHCLLVQVGSGAQIPANQTIRTVGAHFAASDFTNRVTKCVLVRFAGTIQESTVNVDVAGAGSTNNVIDIITVTKASWAGPASGSSITASAKPTAGTSLVVTDATLTGWSKSVAADTFVCFVPTSLSNATFEDISVKLTAN